MALFTLNEGSHYHQWPPISTLPWIGAQSMSRTVTFSPECQYALPAYDAEDVNKLFGLSFGFGGVHHNSARDGWRWSMGDQCQEVLAYCYVNGQRNWDSQMRFPVIAQVGLSQPFVSNICYDKLGYYVFDIYTPGGTRLGGSEVKTVLGLPSYGLTHGIYFGGELAAPHEMSVRIDRT